MNDINDFIEKFENDLNCQIKSGSFHGLVKKQAVNLFNELISQYTNIWFSIELDKSNSNSKFLISNDVFLVSWRLS